MKVRKTSLHKAGFPPVAAPDSRLLILGSMPGERSLEQQEYYAHPRNLFWSFVAGLNDEEAPGNYDKKKELLTRLKIALWDVCDACIRQGSLDTAIVQETPNDIPQFLKNHPSIHTVAFNGQKAAALFRKHFQLPEGIRYIILPSTSPANAGISIGDKRNAWLSLRDILMP